MLRRVALVSCLLGGLACASPSVAPLGAGPITPGPGERVAVTQNYLVVDSSESVMEAFPTQKALVESFVAAQPEGTYEQAQASFHTGDRLVLFTDGISEAFNAAEEEFGEARLADVVVANRSCSAPALQARLAAAVADFSEGRFQDDATLIVMAAE